MTRQEAARRTAAFAHELGDGYGGHEGAACIVMAVSRALDEPPGCETSLVLIVTQWLFRTFPEEAAQAHQDVIRRN
jgi:hypothetical protein